MSRKGWLDKRAKHVNLIPNKKPPAYTGGMIHQGLFLSRSTNGAGFSADAAFDALIGIDNVLAVAFCDSFNLRFVTLPSGITIIGAEAFASKTTLVAPAASSAQKTAEQAGYETYEKVSVYKDSGMELCWVERNGQAVVAGAFGDGKTLVVPDEIAGVRVTKIRDWAFEGCASLTAITLPHSLEEIGACAFYRCTSLTSVTLLQEKTILGFWVFKDCPRMTSVSTPPGIVEI